MVESNNVASDGNTDEDKGGGAEMRNSGQRNTRFTISTPTSPEKNGGDVRQDVKREGSGVVAGDEDGGEDGNGLQETQLTLDEGTQNDDSQGEQGDLMFKKKDVRRSRTQSFQSVLSSASLKSLKQLYTNNQQQGPQGQPLQRTNSFISTHSNPNTVKNFQSFIQAPVLSSISNLRGNVDDVEIGQRLPFSSQPGNYQGDRDGTDCGSKGNGSSSTTSLNDDDEAADQDTMMQQQKLTLNALRKLTLSPMPIINGDESMPQRKLISRKSSSKLTDKSSRNPEPYQPAEVDLSSFASLTRQPKLNPNEVPNEVPGPSSSVTNSDRSPTTSNPANNSSRASESAPTNKSGTPKRPPALPSLMEQSDSSIATSSNTDDAAGQILATQRYHNEVHQNHLQNVRAHIKDLPGVNSGTQRTGPSSLSDARRKSGQQVPIHQPVPRPQHHPYQPNKPKINKQLKQINSLRSPMYIPAVLRMTQDISRSQSATSSPQNDFFPSNVNDSSDSHPGGSSETTPSVQNHLLHNVLQENLTSTLSRGSTNSVESFKSTESSSPPVMSPTGPYTVSKRKYETILRQAPTRKHWIRDESVNKCGIPTCSKVFNFFERRHHCRKCGGIYCKEHTSHYLYINHLAQFTTGGRGTLSKVCDNCIEEYNEFMKHEFGVTINPTYNKKISTPQSSHILKKQQSADKLGKMPKESLIKSVNNLKLGDSTTNRNDQPVGSVPANWSWSSF